MAGAPRARRDADNAGLDGRHRRLHAGEVAWPRGGPVGGQPKNLIITAGAAASIAESGLSSGDAAVVIAVFVVVASLSVAGLVAYRLFGGDGARESLDRLRAWLGIHNAAVMTAILAVIGAKLIGDGLGGI